MSESQNCQNTLNGKIHISGIGLFSGKKVSMSLIPAPEDHGIVFKRLDLASQPTILANVSNVEETDRTTFLGLGKHKIQTVEHLLSALSAYNIDNLLIEINGFEVPIVDGSSKEFAKLIKQVGIKKQNKQAKVLKISQPISFSEKHVDLIALPSDEYKISFTLHHPFSEFLNSQYFSYKVDSRTYLSEIAPSRTYSIYEEIKYFLDNNLIKGGSLENAVVIKDNKVINSEGMRFPNEMVRHKILDLIGDLSLTGCRLSAHIISIRSGHLTNIRFAKKLFNLVKERDCNEQYSIKS